MNNQENQDNNQLLYYSPYIWVIIALSSIVIGFLIYGLQKTEQKNKEKLEKRELEK